MNNEYVNWDSFWKRVEKHPLFLKFLYYVHLRQYTKLLKPLNLKNPEILELGAGTGIISTRIAEQFMGTNTLIDNNSAAFEMFKKFNPKSKQIEYWQVDFLATQIDRKFDLVMSDGLLEHFKDKRRIIERHRDFACKEGYILIFAVDNNRFNKFLSLGEKNIGFSEPLDYKDCLKLISDTGLEIINSTSYFFEYGILCRNSF